MWNYLSFICFPLYAEWNLGNENALRFIFKVLLFCFAFIFATVFGCLITILSTQGNWFQFVFPSGTPPTWFMYFSSLATNHGTTFFEFMLLLPALLLDILVIGIYIPFKTGSIPVIVCQLTALKLLLS